MIDNIYLTIVRYWDFYCRYFLRQWDDMTPTSYGALLVFIGAVGWLLMKNSVRK